LQKSSAVKRTPARSGGYCRSSEEDGSHGRTSQGESMAMAERGQRTCITIDVHGQPARCKGARQPSARLRGGWQGSGKEIGGRLTNGPRGSSKWRAPPVLRRQASSAIMRLGGCHRFSTIFGRGRGQISEHGPCPNRPSKNLKSGRGEHVKNRKSEFRENQKRVERTCVLDLTRTNLGYRIHSLGHGQRAK